MGANKKRFEKQPSLVPKLCLGTHRPEALLRDIGLGRGITFCLFVVATKQSFGACRSQAELGNEILLLPLSAPRRRPEGGVPLNGARSTGHTDSGKKGRRGME